MNSFTNSPIINDKGYTTSIENKKNIDKLNFKETSMSDFIPIFKDNSSEYTSSGSEHMRTSFSNTYYTSDSRISLTYNYYNNFIDDTKKTRGYTDITNKYKIMKKNKLEDIFSKNSEIIIYLLEAPTIFNKYFKNNDYDLILDIPDDFKDTIFIQIKTKLSMEKTMDIYNDIVRNWLIELPIDIQKYISLDVETNE